MNLFLTSAFGFSDNASEKGRCVYHSLRKEGRKELRNIGRRENIKQVITQITRKKKSAFSLAAVTRNITKRESMRKI